MPNVSLCEQENEVHYNPYVDPYGGHEYVEIGGLKWATMNVGASSVTDYGNYYQYGKGASTYQETSEEFDYDGTEEPLAASADTATQVWGNPWRMPTRTEMQALTANTNYEWVENFNGSDVNGGKFTDKNDSSKYIFIPASGYYNTGTLDFLSETSFVGGSTRYSSNRGYTLSLKSSGVSVERTAFKYGKSVRPVAD